MATASVETTWIPTLDTAMLDGRMDNAMRRVSGSVGLDIAMDKGRMRTMKETAVQALEAGAASPGPLFMRIGQGVFEAGLCKIGRAVDPREVRAEILYEFHAEAVAAFQAARAALASEALAFLEKQSVSEPQRRAVLAAAEGVFVAPDKDMFTREALPFANTVVAPSTLAFLGALAGFAGVFALVRSPHLGILSGLIIGGGAYYLARRGMRARCEALLQQLPRNLYQMLATEWNATIRRYAETINAGLTSRTPGGEA